MSSTWSSLGRVSKWFEAPCQNPAIGSCFMCQKTPLPSVFIWGEFGISSFPWHIAVSSLRCLDPRSCPGSSDTGDEFGGCSPYPPLVPTPGSPCLPLPSSSAAWDVPGLGRAHKGGFEGRELGSSKFPSPQAGCGGVPAHPTHSSGWYQDRVDAHREGSWCRGDRGKGPPGRTLKSH